MSLKQLMRRGHDFRDLICPDSMKFRAKHIEIGDGKFARVLFLKNYGSFIKDTALTALTEFPRNLMLSVDILPIPTEQAIKDVQNRILAVETDITRWQLRQNDNNNFSAQPPYDMTHPNVKYKTKIFSSFLRMILRQKRETGFISLPFQKASLIYVQVNLAIRCRVDMNAMISQGLQIRSNILHPSP